MSQDKTQFIKSLLNLKCKLLMTFIKKVGNRNKKNNLFVFLVAKLE